MKPSILFHISLTLLATTSRGKNLVIDSFDQGNPATMVNEGGLVTVIPGPIGTSRSLGAGGRLAKGASTQLIYAPQYGFINFTGSGYHINGQPVGMSIYYLDGGPYFLSKYTAITLDLTDVFGEGTLSIGTSAGFTKVPVTTSGLITLPFSEWISPLESTEQFTYLSIIWENTTYSAGFTLREIAAIQTAIPEPAAYATLASLAALSTLMFRRPHRKIVQGDESISADTITQ